MRNAIVAMTVGGMLTVAAGQAVASETVGEIKRLEGSALISQGERFVAAREGMPLHELDRLMVLEDSTALVAFSDGCERQMTEKELLVVAGADMCAKKPANYEGVERTAQSALETTTGAGAGALIFGVVALAGVALGVSTDEQRREPFSVE
jgi:hypothetical protein